MLFKSWYRARFHSLTMERFVYINLTYQKWEEWEKKKQTHTHTHIYWEYVLPFDCVEYWHIFACRTRRRWEAAENARLIFNVSFVIVVKCVKFELLWYELFDINARNSDVFVVPFQLRWIENPSQSNGNSTGKKNAEKREKKNEARMFDFITRDKQ